ncbi:hypothetical protein ERJ75_001384100 [Trypanosoma vivax]|nr:hypothetical protein ERJ75_001384100 [Trypanosoma vivax]
MPAHRAACASAQWTRVLCRTSSGRRHWGRRRVSTTTLPFPERSHRGRATHGRRAKGGVIARHALGWRRVTSTHVRDTRAQVRHNVSDLPARVSRCALTRPCSCVRPRAVATVSRTETDSECRGRSGRPPLERQVAWLGTCVLFGNRPYWEKGFAPALVHACVGPALCLLSLSDSLGKRPPRRTGYVTEREFARGIAWRFSPVRWVGDRGTAGELAEPGRDACPKMRQALGTSQNGSSGAEVRTRAALTTSLAALDAERDRPSARALHARVCRHAATRGGTRLLAWPNGTQWEAPRVPRRWLQGW